MTAVKHRVLKGGKLHVRTEIESLYGVLLFKVV